jgi:hypothetical protein
MGQLQYHKIICKKPSAVFFFGENWEVQRENSFLPQGNFGNPQKY